MTRTATGKRVTAGRLGRIVASLDRRIGRRQEAECLAVALGRAGYGESRLAAQARVVRKRVLLRYAQWFG
jgi:hypothetical protein